MNQDDVDAVDWFHAIDFGDVRSPGRIGPTQPPNWTLFGVFYFLEHMNLDGARVLDLGTMDGLSAFAMKGLGASDVVATDLWDRRQFRLGRQHLGWEEEIEYHTGLDIGSANDVLGSHQFDVMVFAGVLYHLMSPLEALIRCRRLLKDDGLLLLETCYAGDATGMALLYNQGMPNPVFNEPTTYFLPTMDALLAMMRTASLTPITWMRSGTSNRISVLARAVKPSEVSSKTELQSAHDRYTTVRNHFAFGDLFYSLEHEVHERSSVTVSGLPKGECVMDLIEYRPTVPFQPSWESPS